MVSLMLCLPLDVCQTQRFDICWDFIFLGSSQEFMIFSNEFISVLKILVVLFVHSCVYSVWSHSLLEFKLLFVSKLKSFPLQNLGLEAVGVKMSKNGAIEVNLLIWSFPNRFMCQGGTPQDPIRCQCRPHLIDVRAQNMSRILVRWA